MCVRGTCTQHVPNQVSAPACCSVLPDSQWPSSSLLAELCPLESGWTCPSCLPPPAGPGLCPQLSVSMSFLVGLPPLPSPGSSALFSLAVGTAESHACFRHFLPLPPSLSGYPSSETPKLPDEPCSFFKPRSQVTSSFCAFSRRPCLPPLHPVQTPPEKTVL